MAVKRRWKSLSQRTRRLLLLGAGFEGSLKLAALIDLRRVPADRLRGPKLLWAAALVLVNTGGILPVIYFLRSRKQPAV